MLMLANCLFPLTLVTAAAPFILIALFVDEILIHHRYAKLSQLLNQVAGSLIMVPAFVSFGWWVLVNIRDIKNKHVRLAAGYAQPSAEEILAQLQATEPRFGLFLRGFEAEAASITYAGPNPETDSSAADLHARHIEALLIEMLDANLPLVALADPRDPEPLAGVYRFERVPEAWTQFIGELLPAAFPVVLHLTSFTPGIMIELDMIRPARYAAKTVIIVGRNLAVSDSPDGKLLLKLLSGRGHVVFEQIAQGWSRQHETDFHARLHDSLLALQHAAQTQQPIVRKQPTRFTVVTPSQLRRVLKFMQGPALGTTIIYTLALLVMLLTKGHVDKNVWTLAGRLCVGWAIMVVALSVLKGLTYVLGFPQKLGDNQQYPTFSRVLRWVKRYSVTPR